MKLIYLSKTRLDYSLNSAYLQGLKQNNAEVLEFFTSEKGIRGYINGFKFIRKHKNEADFIVVGYNSPGFVVLAKIFSRKKIIYNSVLSEYERLIISRELASRFSAKAFYYWLADFFAVHYADLVLVETNLQANFYKKLFNVSRDKLFRAWIGVDGDRFFYDPNVKKSDVFTVLFRGALQPEAGAEYIIKAAKILEGRGVQFIVIGGGAILNKIKALIEEVKPNNLQHIEGFMSYDDLRRMMQPCHISLGQLSNHERLKRTIPHKVYESLAMKLPYLTATNEGILELLKPGVTCLVCNPADAESLAEKILWARDNYLAIEKIAENGYMLYQDELKSSILVRKLLDRISRL